MSSEKGLILMKSILKYIAVFLAVVMFCTVALSSVATIPRNRIQNNLEKSAEYLTAHETHFRRYLVPGVTSSMVDEVADANLLNIAYFLDSAHPLQSAMRCDCYYTRGHENDMFRDAVMGDILPNEQYFRYWHGSLIFIRPLLMLLNIQQIYWFHCFVTASLVICLLILLFRNGLKREGIALILSMIAVSLWTVPMCLEFTWMFLLMFAVSIVAVYFALKEKYNGFGFLFFITGMITIFLDFFTTETLTVLIPLLLTLRIRKQQGKTKSGKFALKCCVLWGIGYVTMWAAKWGLASLVLKTNVISSIHTSVEEHLASANYSSQLLYLLSILQKNLCCLFPVSIGFFGAIIIFLAIFFFLFLPICQNRVVLKKGILWPEVGCYAALGCVPYIRFVSIPHHSWYHYFFTYRAQAATVMAICFIVLELLEYNPKRRLLRAE